MKSEIIGALVLFLLAGCGDSGSAGGAAAGGSNAGGAETGGAGGAAQGTSDRGQYLVDTVLVCGHCHTPSDENGAPDLSKYLAGSRSYDFTTDTGEIVSVYAENLTSSPEQGIGEWTDEMVRTAITQGRDDVDVALWPIMPYPEYALLSEADLASVVLYLRSLDPNENVVASDTLPDPYPPAVAITDSQIPQSTLPAEDAAFESALRGRYLSAVGCVNCHTPEISPGNPKFDQAFAGGRTYVSRSDLAPSTSTNLTPAASGLQGWTVDDIVAAMKTNTSKDGTPLCGGAPHRMGDMLEADLTDIATYLHSLPAIESGPFQCQQ